LQELFGRGDNDRKIDILKHADAVCGEEIACFVRCTDSSPFAASWNLPSGNVGMGLYSDTVTHIFQRACLTGDTSQLDSVYDGERLQQIKEKIEVESFLNSLD